MFKLIKIENSGVNQPEPIRVKAFYDINYKTGHAYQVRNNVLLSTDSNEYPTHIAIENLTRGEKDTVLCYRIQENMIFETIACENASYAFGEEYDAKIGSTGGLSGINNTQNEPKLRVVKEVENAKIGDPVLVRFIRN